MNPWQIEQVIHFGPGRLVKDGLAHFGFHDRLGRYYAIDHTRHFLAAVGPASSLLWTLAASPVFPGIPNIAAGLSFPMYIDSLPNGELVVSNFGNARLYRVDPRNLNARLLIDGLSVGMVDMGNCIVDADGMIWINEVTGCRIWQFDLAGRPIQVIGRKQAGFQLEPAGFDRARFNWIYDMRLGPDGNIYVLDSRNYALRRIDPAHHQVITLAGIGRPGYSGDGQDASRAVFGGDPSTRFDGPISLSLDERGDIFIGDRYNHVVRWIDQATGIISTIAGHSQVGEHEATDPLERDPLRASLPQISSMNYHAGRLYVPTDLTGDEGDLVILKRMVPAD